MNQTFNLNRFSKLFVKHTADNYKTYLMSFAVLLGVLFISMGFIAYVDNNGLSARTQIPFFIFVYILAGSIFTSIIFSDLGNKRKAISILTLPASHFEKYLVGWVYSFVIFQLLFIPSFYLVVIIIQALTPIKEFAKDEKLMDLFSEKQKVYFVFYLFAALHAVAFWGSVFFKKHHFIKTAFVFLIGVFALSYLNNQFIQFIISEGVGPSTPFGGIGVRENGGITMVVLKNDYIYSAVAVVAVVILMWTSTFFRLKEKEV